MGITSKASTEEMTRFLNLIAAPGQVVELRLLKVQRGERAFPLTMSGYFDDYGKLAAEAAKHSVVAQGAYVTINPVNAALLARSSNRLKVADKDCHLTTDADIIVRRWMPIDFDPVRPAGISSTDAEHELAIDRAFQVRNALREDGWPDPIVGDSGNGAHLLYRIDLPVNDDGLLKRCLQSLAFRFDDAKVKVDQTVCNPARIWKLYGTASRKGDNLPTRPHRLSRILESENPLVSVPRDLLQALASSFPALQTEKSGKVPSTAFDLDGWIAEHGIEAQGPVPWNGGRKWVLNSCPWNGEHQNRSAYIVQLSNGAMGAGCLHNSCRGRNWASLRDIVEPGWRTKRRGESSGETTSDFVWEPPIPFNQFDLPSFPVDAFPGWLREFADALATATQTPVDLVSMLVLTVIAAACAKKVEVQVKDGYTEPINIFTATALPSGTRKSTVFEAVTKPLEEYQRAETRRTAGENAMRRSRRKIKEMAHQRFQEQAAAAEGANQTTLIKQAEAMAAELADSRDLLPTRLIADDCTPESLATLLCDNGGRIAVLSAEGDVFELLAGRYSASRVPNFAVYLKGHAGDQLHTDRRERTEFVDRPALTVGLTVQPDVIRRLAEKHGFRERGLLGRFLYAMPKSLLGRRDTNPPPMSDEVRNEYHRGVLGLLDLPLRRDEHGDANPHLLALDPDAFVCMQGFANWIEPKLSEFGDLGGMTDWAGKLFGATARIAGILHMGGMVASAEPWDTPISVDTVKNAIRIAKYLIPHAKAAYSEMGADEDVTHAKLILRWIEAQNCSSFTRRDLHQAIRGTFKRANDLERPLAVLADQGFIRARPDLHTGPGRPSSPAYEVNPLSAGKNAHPPRILPVGHFEDCEDSEMHRAAAGSRLA